MTFLDQNLNLYSQFLFSGYYYKKDDFNESAAARCYHLPGSQRHQLWRGTSRGSGIQNSETLR